MEGDITGAMEPNDTKELLNEWRIDAPLPATFNSNVWRRIEAARPVRLSRLFSTWVEQLFARPAVAVGYSMVALAIGLMLGQMHASRDVRVASSSLQYRYIHSIDPYAKPVE